MMGADFEEGLRGRPLEDREGKDFGDLEILRFVTGGIEGRMRLFRRLLFGALLLMGCGLFGVGGLDMSVFQAPVGRPEVLRCLPDTPEPTPDCAGWINTLSIRPHFPTWPVLFLTGESLWKREEEKDGGTLTQKRVFKFSRSVPIGNVDTLLSLYNLGSWIKNYEK